jgi:hypothetical protein
VVARSGVSTLLLRTCRSPLADFDVSCFGIYVKRDPIHQLERHNVKRDQTYKQERATICLSCKHTHYTHQYTSVPVGAG